MKRYLSVFVLYWSLLLLFWQTAIAAELEYRVNFAIAFFTSLGNLAGSWFALSLFYGTDYNFGGPGSRRQAAVLSLGQGVNPTVFKPWNNASGG